MYIHLQLKELVMFADAFYDQIMLLSLHPPPRDGCPVVPRRETQKVRLQRGIPQKSEQMAGVGVRHPYLGMKKNHGGTEPDNFIPYFFIYTK
jgi:hypothetical protein